MAIQSSEKLNTTKYEKAGTTSHQINTVSYVLIGICFIVFLLLSSLNDYLFFEWLVAVGFIVLALTGIHFIGQKQIKRN